MIPSSILTTMNKIAKKIAVLFFFISIALLSPNKAMAFYSCDSSSKIRDSTGLVIKLEKYKNGLACGTWLYYNKNGSVIKKEKYKRGLLRYTLLLNEKGQLLESIDRKGKHRMYKPCNCK